MGKQVGQINKTEASLVAIEPAKELIINVDGGHINTVEKGKRSFESMTSVIYRPESLKANKKGTRNTITNKHCAASALNGSKTDDQQHYSSSSKTRLIATN